MRTAGSIVREDAAALRIAALTPFSTIDFPGHLAAILHLQGCPLACPYCHSPHLQAPGKGAVAWSGVEAFLNVRRGLLDGVVFTGGEPCAQGATGAAVAACRARGYAAALHTCGLYPEALARLLPALDWIGLDWKAPPDDTRRTTGRAGLGPRFARALALVLRSGVAHEIRTTWHPALLSPEDMTAMARALAAAGADSWVIQRYWIPACATAPTALEETMRPFPPQLLDDLRVLLPQVSLR